MSDLIGKSFGRYHILEQLGEGGMAVVYKAFDTRLEADVAVKVIRTDNIPQNAMTRALKRFEREARALAKLTHPNIVSVTDYGEQDGSPYLVMKYLPGGTLKQRMGKPIPWRDAIRLLLPIADALDYAHNHNTIHRDVKPSNILIAEGGQPMLTDFGIAKILDQEETVELTGTSVAVGTPEYMAPEQATARTADHRADIYALGIVLYEMITGRKPYTADTPMAVLIMHARDPLPSPKKFVPGLPDGVEKLLLKALAKRPEDRYQSMAEMMQGFERLLGMKQQVVQKVISSLHEDPGPSNKKRINIIPISIGIGLVGLLAMIGLVSAFSRWSGSAATITSTEVPTSTALPNTASPQASTPTASPVFTVTVEPTPMTAIIRASEGGGAFLRDAPGGNAIQTFNNGTTVMIIPNDTQRLNNVDWVHVYVMVNDVRVDGWMMQSVLDIPTPLSDMSSEITDDTGVSMALVPEGSFTMGNNDGYDAERPEHRVYLDAFYIDKYEATNALYKQCVDAGVCDEPVMGNSYTREHYYGEFRFDNYPVIFVNWEMAKTYCEWRGFRLPTEAEWEKAARGESSSTYPWGEETPNCNLANISYFDNYGAMPHCTGDTTPIGSYMHGVSPYGVYDMIGNVAEWVADWYSEDYYQSLTTGVENPLGSASGIYRVIKGGSFTNPYVRASVRWPADPIQVDDIQNRGLGFRCATDATP